MGTLSRQGHPLVSNGLGSNTLFWLLLGQIGSAICGSICQLRPSNLFSIIGSGLRGAIDSISSIFNPNQRQVHQWVRKEVPFKEIPNITSVWADGAILCILVENAIAPNPNTPYHTEKYRAYGHVTIPTIRLGQKLAHQYLSVEPEFVDEEMEREADPEIILRLVKYLQNVKRASKETKMKKPLENERRLTLKERIHQAKKSNSKKPEILRKKRIIHRKRRSKTPEKTALNYSLISNTLIPEGKDNRKQVEELKNKLNEDYYVNEIQAVCELLMVRSSKQKSMQIFNTATRILSTRNSLTPDDAEKLPLPPCLTSAEEEEEKKCEAASDCDGGCEKSSGCVPEGADSDASGQKKSEEKSKPPPVKKKPIAASRDLQQTTPLPPPSQLEEKPKRRTSAPKVTFNYKNVSPNPFNSRSSAASSKLDFSKTDFSCFAQKEAPPPPPEEEAAPISGQPEAASPDFELQAEMPDVANLNMTDDASEGVYFARRLSNSIYLEETYIENPLFRIEKLRKDSLTNSSIDSYQGHQISLPIRKIDYSGVRARQKSLQEAAAAAAESKSQNSDEKNSVKSMKKETKKRYEDAKNFFKNMEQNSMEPREHFFREAPSSRRSSLTSPSDFQGGASQIKYSSFRMKRTTLRPTSEDAFDEEESHQAVKTIQKPDLSAVMASLNSAYDENCGRSISPYDIVREGNEESDSEPPSPERPDVHQEPNLVQRRVSFSQLNQEGDAGIF